MNRRQGLLREPMLHFMLIGLGLFAIYGKAAPHGADHQQITVSQRRVDDLASQYRAAWNRAPSPQELSQLVETYVRDEVMYREAVAMGLESDDPVIRRRLRQKMEVSSEEQLEQVAPTDLELNTYLAEHMAQFTQPSTITFEQILFSAGGPGASPATIQATLSRLQTGADPSEFGQASMLPSKVEDTALDLVARDFGTAFSEQLRALPIGAWQAPITSGFGNHLVRVISRESAIVPTLDEVRPAVLREWENARRESNRERAYQIMRSNYSIRIEARLPGNGKQS